MIHRAIELAGVGRTHAGEDDAPVRALADVSFTIEAGEFVCVTGPSGSGKSTLLHVLGCLDRPTEGAYRVAGGDTGRLDADGLARLRRTVFGFVFQAGYLLQGYSVRENVRLAGEYVGLSRRQAEHRAGELLDSLGLGDRVDHRSDELSGGERQRVAIARALMNHPKVILADEPTGALDSGQGEAVLAALRALAAQGHTVVVATHDRAIANAAPRRIELRDGRLVADSGTPAGAEGATVQAAPPAPAGSLWTWAAWRLVATTVFTTLRLRPLLGGVLMLAVALGAWGVVTTLGVVAGAYGSSLAAIARMGADKISVSGGPIAPLTTTELEGLRELANVRAVDLQSFNRLNVNRADRTVADVDVTGTQGVGLPHAKHVKYTIEQGAFFTQADDAKGAHVVVLNSTLRQALFADDQLVVGEQVSVDGLPFTVTGVLVRHPFMVGGGSANPPELWMPYGVLRTTFPEYRIGGRDVKLGAAAEVWVSDPGRVWETAHAIRDVLVAKYPALEEHWQILLSPHALVVDAYQDMAQNRVTVVGGVAAATLLAAGFGVMSVMLVFVSQRTREIGLRLAVGARPRDVHWQFLTEAAVLACVGGVGGALLGLATGALVSKVADAPVTYDAWFLPAAVGCTVVVGLVFGILPARRAAATNPVAALTTE